jgi:hypothetical protein
MTTPLRQRMIDNMKVRDMSTLTQAAYVRAVTTDGHHRALRRPVQHRDVRQLMTASASQLVRSVGHRLDGGGDELRFISYRVDLTRHQDSQPSAGRRGKVPDQSASWSGGKFSPIVSAPV